MQNQFCSFIQMASSSKSYWPCQIHTHEYNTRSTSSLLYCIPNPINTGTRIMNNDNDLFMFGSEAKIKWKSEKYLLIWYIHTIRETNILRSVRGAPTSFGSSTRGRSVDPCSRGAQLQKWWWWQMQLMRVYDKYSAGDSKIIIAIKCWQHRWSGKKKKSVDTEIFKNLRHWAHQDNKKPIVKSMSSIYRSEF
jgi:hypothetical protein